MMHRFIMLLVTILHTNSGSMLIHTEEMTDRQMQTTNTNLPTR